jgi:replicative DNA helicase
VADPGSERLPPQNRDAERCVLGSMLRDNNVIPELIPLLTADYFYFDAHRRSIRPFPKYMIRASLSMW